MGRQDLVCELAYSGAWQPAPLYVRDRVTITRGQGNETGGPTPQTLQATVDNRSGAYNPRNAASPLYGLIGRNTPIRVGLDLAVESFGGTSSSGWTPTDGGQAWSGIGAAAADFTESAGLGRHLQPLKNIVRVSLLAEERRDVEQVTEASIPAVALGASAVLGHVARWQASGDYYWLRLEFDVGGAVTAKISKTVGGSFTELAVRSGIPGLAYTAGQSYTLLSSVSGSRLTLQVWPTGNLAAAVTLTAVDASPTLTGPGRYGLASWVVAGNTNTTEVRFDNYRAVDRRYTGEVASWKPGRTIDFNLATGKGDAWTETEAAGILRRLGQGAAPSRSPLRRTIGATNPAAYWPGEDGSAATQLASAIGGHPTMTVTGSASFVQVADFGTITTLRFGSAALVNLAAGGELFANVPGEVTAASASQWTVHVRADVDPAIISGNFVVAEWTTPGGTYARWQVVVTAVDTRLIGITAGGASTVLITGGLRVGLATYAVTAQQSGGNISINFWLNSTTSVVGTLTGVTSIASNPTNVTATDQVTVGHFAIWPTTSLPYNSGELETDSYGEQIFSVGLSARLEAAHLRLARLSAEEGVPLSMPAVSAVAAQRMGWQPVGTLTGLLEECAAVDGGILFEARDGLGLVYRTRESLYNQAPKLTLDWSAYEVAPPFTPVVDDLDVRNDITVKRIDGSSARAIETSGPLAAVPPPDGIGVYDTSIDLNLAADSGLADQAGWALHRRTADELRVTRVTVDLVASPGLAAAATAVDIGDRIVVTGLPADMGDDEVSLLVVGYTEVIGSHTRTITFNTVPESVWQVGVWDAGYVYDTDGSETTAPFVAGTDTTMTVATLSGPTWTTTQAPFDIVVSGVRLTVTAVSGSTSPQTFTVTQAPINGITKTIPAGTSVRVWNSAVYAL